MKNIILLIILVVLVFTCVLLNLKTNLTLHVIYAIMITGKDENRFKLAKNSITNFLDQTYPYKRLIIINHGKPLAIEHNDILEIAVDKMNLGTMRNIALELVPYNALWITWDDDDYRDPTLLTYMHYHLVKQNSDAVAITRRIEYNYNTNHTWVMQISSGMVIALCKRNFIFAYLDADTMEDIHLLNVYKQIGKVSVLDNNPELYIRLVHFNNTSLYVDPKKKNIISTGNKNNYQEYPSTQKQKHYVQLILTNYYNNALPKL